MITYDICTYISADVCTIQYRHFHYLVSQYGPGKVMVGGSEIFALDEWVVKIDLFANTIGKWVGLFNKSNPLVKGSGYKTPPPV